MATSIPPSTSPQTPVTTNAPSVESAAPAVTPEKMEPQTPKEDPKAAAKNAEASKQHATEKKSQNDMRGQIVQQQLAKQVPKQDDPMGRAYTWEHMKSDVANVTAGAANASKTEKAATTAKQPQPKTTSKQESETLWQTMKNAGDLVAVKLPTAAGVVAEEAAKSGADHIRHIRRQGVEKLDQRQYKQDMVPGELYEVEKIVPGTTNKTKTSERVEDRSRGDSAARRYHPEQHRESTQSALEDRLIELNHGKELTPFEKNLVAEWGPQRKQGSSKDSLEVLSPIKGLDSTGTKGSMEVQGYKVERGRSDDRQVIYYDRHGNELIDRNTVEHLGRRRYPQDKVRGEMFEVELIQPASKDKTETRKHTEIINAPGTGLPMKAKDHPKEYRGATQSGLEERLTELNGGGPLTNFEKNLVSKWNRNPEGHGVTSLKRLSLGAKDESWTLTPIKGLDSKGEKLDKEVQAYKVTVGNSGDRRTTYYDRNGNELRGTGHSEAPLVNEGLGPIEYLGYAQLGKQIITKLGQKVGQKLAAREAAELAKAETRAAAKGSSSPGQPAASSVPREQWQDVNLANKQGGPPKTPGTDPGRASTQQAPAPAKDPRTLGDTTGGPAPPPPQPLLKPGEIPTRPGSSSIALYPRATDKVPLSIKTPNGVENINGLEYRLRIKEAEGWVSRNHVPSGRGQGPSAELYKEAQKKFGLNDGWENPYSAIRRKTGA